MSTTDNSSIATAAYLGTLSDQITSRSIFLGETLFHVSRQLELWTKDERFECLRQHSEMNEAQISSFAQLQSQLHSLKIHRHIGHRLCNEASSHSSATDSIKESIETFRELDNKITGTEDELRKRDEELVEKEATAVINAAKIQCGMIPDE